MAYSSRDADSLASPSLNDTEAASQQLLAEASSPVRRSTVAPVSASAVLGANLLNHARTLAKPPATAPPASKERAAKLPKLGQLKPAMEKPGKLARTSLSTLVAEASSQKVRGNKMYEIDPSPQKKRPRSLPSKFATVERGACAEEPVVAPGEDAIVTETSQTRSDEDISARSRGGQDGLAAEDQVKAADASRIASLKESTDVPKKQRGRPRKSGQSAVSGPLPRTGTSKVQDVAAQDIRPQEDVEVDHLPSSPPELATYEEEPAATQKRRGRPRKSGESTVSTRLPDEERRARHERTEPPDSPKLKRKAQSGEQQEVEMNAESSSKIVSVKKQRRFNGLVMVSSDVPEVDEDLIASNSGLRNAHLRSDLQPAFDISIRPSRSRTMRAEAEVAHAQEHSATAPITAKATPAARPAQPNRLAKAVSSKPKPSTGSRRSKREAARNVESVEEIAEPVTNKSTVNRDELDVANTEVEISAGVGDNEFDGERSEEDEEDEEQRDGGLVGEKQNDHAELQEEDQADDARVETANRAIAEQSTDGDVNRPPTLDRVFNFAESEERQGICSTKLGRSIHRRCDRSRVILSRSHDACSLEDIAKCKDGIIELLQSIHVKVQGDRRTAFKRDAFAYLFRDLVVVLEAMHDKLQEKQGDITASLDSMQIVYPFIRELLRFKDVMDSWSVVVHQRTKGERLIKGVESVLIAPLRVIEKEFRRHFQQLRKVEETHRVAVEVQRQREEEEQEVNRREEMLRPVRERRKRWQELHIARMQYEPDPSRRRRLRFIEPVQAAEKDANGCPFERVPFFGERSAPPPQWTAVSSGREWTSEEETALLDALQSSASLERLFERHCGPRGVLRDFSVSDIAAKIAWVRSGWAQLSHQHGWEVPEWVKNIPVLP